MVIHRITHRTEHDEAREGWYLLGFIPLYVRTITYADEARY